MARSHLPWSYSTGGTICFGLLLIVINLSSALKKDECEVCIAVMDKFANSLEDDVKKDPKAIETEFRIFCK